jgi:outer membrane protein TolC
MHVGYPVIEIARWGLLYLLASVLLGGCVTVGPDFETPESDVAEEWLEAEDQRISSVPGDYDAWWKSFNDPILSSLIQQAAEQNKTLQIAGLRVFEARAILGIAAGSMYPQVQQAGGSVGRSIRVSAITGWVSMRPGSSISGVVSAARSSRPMRTWPQRLQPTMMSW